MDRYLREITEEYQEEIDQLAEQLNQYRQIEDDILMYQEEIDRLNEKLHRYKTAVGILMEYWDSLPDEEKPKIDKRLKEIGL
tara:strand:- start:2468 stop:2713 length:246 start_codon:yes stop_codon:yes gene_type:complete